MSGPVTAVCPNGHASVDQDFCSVCSAWITDPPVSSRGSRPPIASTPTLVPNPAPVARSVPSSPSGASASEATGPGGAVPMAGGQCSNCSSELDAGARFCEVCGYDPATGSLPSAPVAQPIMLPPLPPPASPTAGLDAPYQSPVPTSSSGPVGAAAPALLLAVVSADRAYYDSQQVGEVQFPVGAPPRVIELPAVPVTIGRRSRSLGTDPALDLAIPPEDPAVSHTHASLLPGDDGTWSLVDHGSTNGTYLNESPEPLPANVPRTVRPGDRIYVGAWTRISLELRPTPPQ
jgi:FHA domain